MNSNERNIAIIEHIGDTLTTLLQLGHHLYVFPGF